MKAAVKTQEGTFEVRGRIHLMSASLKPPNASAG